MNRIDRLHAILVHLQSKKRVTGQEIADRFGISLRSVYRDVKALEESGVPVIGEAGIGYSIMEGYRLPPVMFTQEEAAALLMGVKLTEKFTDELTRKQIENALFKIKSVLRAPDREHIEQLSDNVVVATSRLPLEPAGYNRQLGELQKAIVAGRVVRVTYQTPYREEESKTQRDIEPFGLCYYGSAWHCFAWCRLRKDFRDFKLNRILDLEILQESFCKDQYPPLQEYLKRMVQQNREVMEIKVLFDKAAIRYLGEQKYYYGYVSQEHEGERIRMTFMTGNPDHMATWLFSFADRVEVESPESVKELIFNLFCRLQKKLFPAGTS